MFIEHENDVARRFGGRDRRAAADRVHRPRRADADPDDAVRVHDRQHRLLDLGAAQRPASCRTATARCIRCPTTSTSRASCTRRTPMPDPRHRHPQRARSAVPRAVPDRPTSSRRRRSRSAPSAPTCSRCSTRCAIWTPLARGEAKEYLEGFFRRSSKPDVDQDGSSSTAASRSRRCRS